MQYSIGIPWILNIILHIREIFRRSKRNILSIIITKGIWLDRFTRMNEEERKKEEKWINNKSNDIIKYKNCPRCYTLNEFVGWPGWRQPTTRGQRERKRGEVELASRLHENDILDLHVPLVGLARINGRGYYDAEWICIKLHKVNWWWRYSKRVETEREREWERVEETGWGLVGQPRGWMGKVGCRVGVVTRDVTGSLFYFSEDSRWLGWASAGVVVFCVPAMLHKSTKQTETPACIAANAGPNSILMANV